MVYLLIKSKRNDECNQIKVYTIKIDLVECSGHDLKIKEWNYHFTHLSCEMQCRHWRELLTSLSSSDQPFSFTGFFCVWSFSTSRKMEAFLSERSMDQTAGAEWKTGCNVGRSSLPFWASQVFTCEYSSIRKWMKADPSCVQSST